MAHPLERPRPNPELRDAGGGAERNYPFTVQNPGVSSNGTFAYVAGGYAPGATNALNRYDPIANSWTGLAPVPAYGWGAGSTYAAVNNKVYMFGGFDGTNVTDNTFIYDVSSNTWTSGAGVPGLARYLPAVLYYPPTAKIYVIGGLGGGSPYNFIYDPVADTWDTTSAAWAPQQVGGGAAAIVGQFIYIAGVVPPGSTAFLRYDIVNNIWTQMADLPTPLYGAMGAAVGGEFYVVGGISNSTYLDTTYVYDVASNAWHTGPNTNVIHGWTAGTAIGNRLLVVGGNSGGGVLVITWGVSGDVPVAGDFNGDGISDFTVYRGGAWYTHFATGGSAFAAWGTAGDRPAGRRPGT